MTWMLPTSQQVNKSGPDGLQQKTMSSNLSNPPFCFYGISDVNQRAFLGQDHQHLISTNQITEERGLTESTQVESRFGMRSEDVTMALAPPRLFMRWWLLWFTAGCAANSCGQREVCAVSSNLRVIICQPNHSEDIFLHIFPLSCDICETS